MKTLFVLSLFAISTAFAAEDGAVKVAVDGMSCGSCAMKLESAFKKSGTVDNVYVSVANKTLLLDEKNPMDDQSIEAVIEKAGYKVKSIERTTKTFDAAREEMKPAKS
jgi:copper chaperone CopZ